MTQTSSPRPIQGGSVENLAVINTVEALQGDLRAITATQAQAGRGIGLGGNARPRRTRAVANLVQMVHAKLEAVDRQNIGRAVLDNVYGCGTASKRQRIVANSVDCGSARSLLDELHRAADSAIDGHVAGGHGDGINAGVAIDGAV